jgi:1-deoxyxylulose-5-phosphate synthase
MFPIGPFVDRRYETEILPLCKARGVGSVCFKTFGAGKLLGDTEGYQRPLSVRPRGKVSSGGDSAGTALLPCLTVEQCVRYTLTMDPDVTLLGLSFPNEQDLAWAAARTFVPFSAEELATVRDRAKEAIEGKGDIWWNPAV